MKKLLALALASAMVLSLAACGSKDQPSGSQSSGSSSSGDKVVKIGVFEPATGDSASGGKRKCWVCSTPTLRPPLSRWAARPIR